MDADWKSKRSQPDQKSEQEQQYNDKNIAQDWSKRAGRAEWNWENCYYVGNEEHDWVY